MANISLAFLEPTITTWMNEVMPDVSMIAKLGSYGYILLGANHVQN